MRTIAPAALAATVLLVAACSGDRSSRNSANVDATLQRDLELAAAQSLELAGTGGTRMDIMSSAERIPVSEKPRPSTRRRIATPKPTPEPTLALAEVRTGDEGADIMTVANEAEGTVAAVPAVATRPRPIPMSYPAGGMEGDASGRDDGSSGRGGGDGDGSGVIIRGGSGGIDHCERHNRRGGGGGVVVGGGNGIPPIISTFPVARRQPAASGEWMRRAPVARSEPRSTTGGRSSGGSSVKRASSSIGKSSGGSSGGSRGGSAGGWISKVR